MAPVPAAVSANQIIPGTPLPWCASFLRACCPALPDRAVSIIFLASSPAPRTAPSPANFTSTLMVDLSDPAAVSLPVPSAGPHLLRSLRRGARPGNGQREGRPQPLTPERPGRRPSPQSHRT